MDKRVAMRKALLVTIKTLEAKFKLVPIEHVIWHWKFLFKG
jgi:hypothetical protein